MSAATLNLNIATTWHLFVTTPWYRTILLPEAEVKLYVGTFIEKWIELYVIFQRIIQTIKFFFITFLTQILFDIMRLLQNGSAMMDTKILNSNTAIMLIAIFKFKILVSIITGLFGEGISLLVCGMYIMWLKKFKPWKKPAMVGSIMVVGVLACCTLFHSMCDLKAMQMNLWYSLIWELLSYEFELDIQKDLLCDRWRCSWSQYRNQMVQEILLGLQEPQQ